MDLARTIRDNRATVICAVLVIVALAAGFAALAHARTSAGDSFVALVHDADGVVHELPLDKDVRLEISTSLGHNTVVVEDGAVRMEDADCPNRTCLQVHPLTAPGAQIICLPNQLWIEVVPQGETGGVMDVTLAEDLGDDVDLQAR